MSILNLLSASFHEAMTSSNPGSLERFFASIDWSESLISTDLHPTFQYKTTRIHSLFTPLLEWSLVHGQYSRWVPLLFSQPSLWRPSGYSNGHTLKTLDLHSNSPLSADVAFLHFAVEHHQLELLQALQATQQTLQETHPQYKRLNFSFLKTEKTHFPSDLKLPASFFLTFTENRSCLELYHQLERLQYSEQFHFYTLPPLPPEALAILQSLNDPSPQDRLRIQTLEKAYTQEKLEFQQEYDRNFLQFKPRFYHLFLSFFLASYHEMAAQGPLSSESMASFSSWANLLTSPSIAPPDTPLPAPLVFALFSTPFVAHLSCESLSSFRSLHSTSFSDLAYTYQDSFFQCLSPSEPHSLLITRMQLLQSSKLSFSDFDPNLKNVFFNQFLRDYLNQCDRTPEYSNPRLIQEIYSLPQLLIFLISPPPSISPKHLPSFLQTQTSRVAFFDYFLQALSEHETLLSSSSFNSKSPESQHFLTLYQTAQQLYESAPSLETQYQSIQSHLKSSPTFSSFLEGISLCDFLHTPSSTSLNLPPRL